MKKNKSGFSVIISLLMVGFMLVLTSGIFLLVLLENKDTKAMEYYIKSFAGAEASIELALLKEKQYNYSINYKLEEAINDKNIVLAQNPLNKNEFHQRKDVLLSYEIDSASQSIENKSLASGEFDIFPLFYYNQNGDYVKVTSLEVNGLNENVVWNIVGDKEGISGKSNFNNYSNGNLKSISGENLNFATISLGDFLERSSKNYLIIHNVSSESITYTIKSLKDNEFLTKGNSYIVGTGKIGGYKQNLRVDIDTGKYLNLLKYSVFSN